MLLYDKNARNNTLYKAGLEAEGHGMPKKGAEQLQQLVMGERFDVFRRAIIGEYPADVEPMVVKLNAEVRTVRAKPRAYPRCNRRGSLSTWIRWPTLGW